VAYRPLLGNDHKRSNDNKAVARQEPVCNSGSTVGSSVFCVVCSEAVSRNRLSSVHVLQCSAVQCTGVQWSGASWLVSD
jgi:hypothetical protein